MNLFASLCVFGFVLVCTTTARNIKETEKLLADLEKDLQDIKQEEKRVADALSTTRKSFKKSVNDEGECILNDQCDNEFSVCVNTTCVCPHGGAYPDCEEGFICFEHEDCNGGNTALGDCVDHKCMCVYDQSRMTGCTDSCYNECRPDQVCNGDQDDACICRDGLIPVGDSCQVPCIDDECDAGFICGNENECVCKDDEAPDGQCPACEEECADNEECHPYQIATSEELLWKCQCEEDYVRDEETDECVEKQCGYDDDDDDDDDEQNDDGDDECGENEGCRNFLCKCKYGGVPGDCFDECGNQCSDGKICIEGECECPEGLEEDNGECVEVDSCENIECPEDQECLDGKCQCPKDSFITEGLDCAKKQCGEGTELECGENEMCKDFMCVCEYGGELGSCLPEGNECPAGEMMLKDSCVENPCHENERLERITKGKRRGFQCVCPKPAFSLTDDGCVSNCPDGCAENEVCGKKGCSCPRNGFYKNREGECKECGCGPNGRCKRNGTCNCKPGFEDVSSYCVEPTK